MTTQKPRVLVVEDSPESYAALARLLRHVGYEAVGAATLAQAQELLHTMPRYLILDLMLPDGNGKDLLAQIRREKLGIKVAVLTAVDDKPALREVAALEPDALFCKPVDVPQLLAWLREGGRRISPVLLESQV
jgi:DNA-binding response OmpR family regulator